MEQSQAHITHNNLPLTIGNKFRNQINQNTPPDVLNVNQQRYYHDVFDNFATNTNYNNVLKIGGTSAAVSNGGGGGGGASGSSATGGISSASSSSTANVANATPIAVASIFGASSSAGVQGASIANTSLAPNANANNSNVNNENR